MIELRDYQQNALDIIKKALKIKNNCLIVQPCAAGKTVEFVAVVDWLIKNNRTCLILLDRKNLIKQTYDRINSYLGIDDKTEIICSTLSKKKDFNKQIIVASRQTLCPLLEKGFKIKINLLIIDEAHFINEKEGQYKKIIDSLRIVHPDIRILGCTATPYRMKTGYIYGENKTFNAVDYKTTTQELIDKNWLCPLKWKVRQSDLNSYLDKVKISSNGELNEKEQAEILEKSKYIKAVYDIYCDYYTNRKTAIFALTIKHAQLIADIFKSNGVNAFVIHSKLKDNDIDTAIKNFSDTPNSVIINVGILTIGSDIPSITGIILARRTRSTALFFQIVGRGARLHEGKTDCLITDMCGNWSIHGNDPDNPIVIIEPNKEPKLKLCPKCEALNNMNAKICVDCGFEFPSLEKDKVKINKPEVETKKKPEIIDLDGKISKKNKIINIESDRIAFKKHIAIGKATPCLKIEFYKGFKYLGHCFVFPEHTGSKKLAQKTKKTWFDLGGFGEPPKTVDDWIKKRIDLLYRCWLTIDKAGEYPEIIKIYRWQ